MRTTGLLGALLLAAATLAAGCGGDDVNHIDGSLTASYDMGFDTVRIRRFTTEISIEYVRSPGPGEELPLKLTASFVENDITVGEPIDLHAPSGTYLRVTTDNAELPELCDQEERPSTITFSEYGENEGDSIAGEWRMCFENGLDGVGGFHGDLDVIE